MYAEGPGAAVKYLVQIFPGKVKMSVAGNNYFHYQLTCHSFTLSDLLL